MLDSLLFKKLFHLCILEVGSIIASNLLDSQAERILSSSQESLHSPLGFTFILQEEHPSEVCVTIHNN
jgi:hypothetical protein